jgi:polyisoprenoid-binding protein YceI
MRWTIDPTHSHLDFAVKHLGISTVRGRFKVFSGEAETAADGTPIRIVADVDATSIDTGVEQRDQHLKSPDFLDVATHPVARFESQQITKAGDTRWQVAGTLTLRGVAKPVALTLELSPPAKDPWGNQKVAVTAEGRINRTDWGLTWNQVLEAGGVLVSEDVKLALDVQAVAA